MWCNDIFSMEATFSNMHWLGITGKCNQTGLKFVCVNVYVLQTAVEKRVLWSEMSTFISNFGQALVILLEISTQ